jgi:hypothetical protein
MLEVSEKCLSGKGPFDGHASNRPESLTMDGKEDKNDCRTAIRTLGKRQDA